MRKYVVPTRSLIPVILSPLDLSQAVGNSNNEHPFGRKPAKSNTKISTSLSSTGNQFSYENPLSLY